MAIRNILTDQSKRGSLRKPSFRVTDQPFIFSGKELVLSFCCFFKSHCFL